MSLCHGSRLHAAVTLLSALLAPASGTTDPPPLSHEERIAAQMAIECLYYSHPVGTARTLEEAVPKATIEEKVRRHLLLSAALQQVWNAPVTARAFPLLLPGSRAQHVRRLRVRDDQWRRPAAHRCLSVTAVAPARLSAGTPAGEEGIP